MHLLSNYADVVHKPFAKWLGCKPVIHPVDLAEEPGDWREFAGRWLRENGIAADRVLLVGLGKERDFRDREFRSAVKSAVKLLNETGSYEAVIYLTEEKVKRREVAWRVEHAVVVAMDVERHALVAEAYASVQQPHPEGEPAR